MFKSPAVAKCLDFYKDSLTTTLEVGQLRHKGIR